MILINCIVEENDPIQAVLDTIANVNCISEKNVDGMKMAYEKDDSNSRVKSWDGAGSYFTLEKVNLHIGFNDSEKRKTISSEFIILGPDWPEPDLILEMP